MSSTPSELPGHPAAAHPGAETRVSNLSLHDAARDDRAETDLRESELRFRALFEQAPVSMQRFTPDGYSIRVNRAYERLFHLTDEQLAKAKFNLLRDPQIAATGLLPLFQRAFSGEHVLTEPTPFTPGVAVEGGRAETRYIRGHLFPIRDAAGNIREIIAIHEDLTEQIVTQNAIREINQTLEEKIAERTHSLEQEIEERRVTEAALKESEAKLRSLFENTGAGVVLLDGITMLEVNPAGLRLLGVSDTADAVGRSILDFSMPEQLGGLSVSEAVKRLAEARKQSGGARFEWLLRNAQGLEVPVEGYSSSVEVRGKVLAQVLMQDISERKRAERELRNSLDRERELSQLKSSFISMVSHEYRNPLGIILSSTELLKRYHERLSPEERMESLLDIESATRRMSSMIDDLLMMGKAEAGKLTLHPASLDLVEFCQVLISEVLSSNHANRQIRFEHSGIEVAATSDEKILRLIFTNLLTNALKYSPVDRAPGLSLSRVGRHAVFVIRDEGIGIPEEDRSGLFEAFRRARNVGLVSGTGLGLYIVKHCVDLHQGTIDIVSAVGKGTTVTVTLPVFPSSTEERNASALSS